jgi:glycosyltransferase involved in cell wall biosynthesis
MHALDYAQLLPPPGVPVLASLHLPRDFYTPEALRPTRPNTWLQCVSLAQFRTMSGVERMLTPVENGVPIPVAKPHAKRSFALAMGRICPEKGFHLAIEASRRAEVPLVIGGQVYAYEAHEHYFDQEIKPRLGRYVRFAGPLQGARKQRLLAAARCVVIASTVAETSSLLAREALAAGTPVVALRRGALVDVIDHGVTGFLVDDVESMAEAIRACAHLDPHVCRRQARARFAEERMIDAHLSVYRVLSAVRPQSFASAT